MSNLAIQLRFRPALPTILNNADYSRRQTELERIDEILTLSGIEAQHVEGSLKKWLAKGGRENACGDQIAKQQVRSRQELRSMILMKILNEPYREMSQRLAECSLYQWFCGFDRLGEIKVPSKSSLDRYSKNVDVEMLRELNIALVQQAAGTPEEQEEQALRLRNAVELETVWLDSTALKANIHFPVDWVLMRDATRTMMLATELIRDHGLKHRMADPMSFLSRMNAQCMAMSAARRQEDSKRKRKRVFREMKKIVKTVRNHALRHRDLLEKEWEQTDWTEAQAMQVIARIDSILALLPEAIKQGQQRIIRGEKVENSEKILSLYEQEVNVIVRGKPGAEIEFGNSLLLAEQKDGLIVDWQLHEKSAPNDSKQLIESIQRIEKAFGENTIKGAVGDRQFDSKKNQQWFQEQKIYNGICPRNPEELKNKCKSAKFQQLQRRRAQTEARIGILKNGFLGNPIKRRGFKQREIEVGWSVLAHNLRVLARLETSEEVESGLAEAA